MYSESQKQEREQHGNTEQFIMNHVTLKRQREKQNKSKHV